MIANRLFFVIILYKYAKFDSKIIHFFNNSNIFNEYFFSQKKVQSKIMSAISLLVLIFRRFAVKFNTKKL